MATRRRRVKRPPADPGRRERILDAAERHFGRVGFKAASIDAIARAARCAKGAVYLDFTSKEALLEQVMERLLERAGAAFLAESAQVTSPLARLELMLRFAYREMAKSPLMERLLAEDPELEVLGWYARKETKVARAKAELAGFEALVRDGIRICELRPDLDVARLPFVMVALKFLYFHAEAATLGMLSREALLDAVVEVFIAGIRRR